MTISAAFQHDDEFLKLLMRQEEIDLATAALEIARDAYPDLDFDETFDWLDDRAEEIAGPVARAETDEAVLAELSGCLAGQWKIRGCAEAFDQADSSYLQCVIQQKQGIPISLSILYIALADRLGVELCGVSSPLHFLTRYESVSGPLFLDAFSGGTVMTFVETAEWLQEITGLSGCQVKSALEPARHRTIIIRMLNNLKVLYIRQENWKAAWNVQHRLVALQPSIYQERRDFALVSLRSQRPGQAIDLINCCLKSCPADDEAPLKQQLEEAHAQLARLN